MKSKLFLSTLGAALPLMVNADCLTPLTTFNDVDQYTNEIGCETGSFWGCAGHGKYAPDGSIRVMTPADSWGRDYNPKPVRAVQTCLYPNNTGGFNSLNSIEYDGGPDINLMYCSVSRAVGMIFTRDTYGYYSDATLWVMNPNDPLYNISNGNAVNLNTLVAPIDLPDDPEGFPRKLIRADDMKGNNILVWATSSNQTVDINGFYEYRHAMLMDMNVTDCLASSPETVLLPSFVNLTLPAAGSQITNLGLSVGAITQTYSSQPAGIVIGQVPAEGTEVAVGSNVNLTVSLGPVTTLPTIYVEAENFTSQFGIQSECHYPASGGCNIGYIREGDWSQYRIDFRSGNADVQYTVRIRYAVWSTSAPRSVTISDPYGHSVDVPLPVTDTSNVAGWGTVDAIFYPLTAADNGVNDIRFTYHGGSMNMDSFEFIPNPRW